MAKQMLHTKALVVKENISEQNGVIDAVVGSTNVLDRMGDIIDQSGWNLKAFKSNPVILWGHNVREEKPPIGKALKVWIENKGSKDAQLMFKVQFDLLDQFAAEIFRKIKDGFINTVSVGFLPTKWEELDPDNWFGGLKYLEQELLELSFVPVPANPDALVGLRSFAAKDKRFTPTDDKTLYPIPTKEVMAEMLHKELKEKVVVKEEVVKPFENEHACRLKNPDDFQDDSFRSTSRNHEGKEYRVIMGKLKGEDTMTDQSLRYNKDTWDESEASTHCKDKGGTFEPAKKEEKPSEKKGAMSDYLEKMGAHIASMGDLHESMIDDASMSEGLNAKAENKEVMVGDIKKMKGHADSISGLCDDMSGMMGGEEAVSGDKKKDVNLVKLETIEKMKATLELIVKSGRVLSAENETKVRQAVELLEKVLAQLDKEPEVTPESTVGTSGVLNSPSTSVTPTDVIEKGVIPYKDLGTLPESEGWDGPGEVVKAEVEDLKLMSTWFDSEKADDKGSYKLPHHKGDGEHKAVWRGVAAAMASLLGAKGGIDIPESDRKGVYDHLAKHYKQFNKEAPDYKMVENQVLGILEEELQALVLDREDKHVVRLVKKVLDNGKKDHEQVVEALKVLNLALSQVNLTKKGGE